MHYCMKKLRFKEIKFFYYLCESAVMFSFVLNLICEKSRKSFDMQNIALLGGIHYDSEHSDKVVWEYLPGSKQEVESIHEQLKRKKKNISYQTAEGATETYFKEVAEQSDIVHVATHGFFFPDPQCCTYLAGVKLFGLLVLGGGRVPNFLFYVLQLDLLVKIL